jgi:hypothetical protein
MYDIVHISLTKYVAFNHNTWIKVYYGFHYVYIVFKIVWHTLNYHDLSIHFAKSGWHLLDQCSNI